MALALPKTCSMGGSQTGLVGTIGVALLNPDGTVHTARATANIYEIGGGCYGKNISFPDNWKGIIKWDTGGGSPVYAVEEYTVDGLVDAAIEDLDDVKGTGFVKDTDSLVDIRPETDKIQTGIIDVPGNFKADVSNLDVAISTRSSHGDPTSGIKGAPGKTNQEVFDNERGTDGAYTGTPPTIDQIAAAVFAKEIDNDGIAISLQGATKLILSVLTGKSSGGGTITASFRDLGDTKNRVSATVTGVGNRTSVVRDAS